MRKLLILVFVIIFTATSSFAWGWKKTSSTPSNTEFDNQGKGYVGTLPDVSKNFSTIKPQPRIINNSVFQLICINTGSPEIQP